MTEEGYYYVQNFAPNEYGAHAQNWAVTQNHDGLVYVANGGGILEYDGVGWRLIPSLHHQRVLSLQTSSDGTIYTGGIGQIGYLAPDSTGNMQLQSLMHLIPEEDQNIGDVWTTLEAHDGIYFQTKNHLLRFKDDKIQVWKSDTQLYWAFTLRDQLYVHLRGEGLVRMESDSLRQVPGGDFFADKRIRSLFPRGSSEYLAITIANGMFECREVPLSETPCVPFRPELTDLIVEALPYRATMMADGRLIIATLKKGAILLEPDGRLFRIMDEEAGLSSSMIWYPFLDQEEDLWLGRNDGLSRVSLSSSITYFDGLAGLNQTVNAVVRHDGVLYTATDYGVKKMEPAEDGGFPVFTAASEMESQCFSLLSTASRLFAGCGGGIWEIETGKRIFSTDDYVYTIHRPKVDTTRLLIGTGEGLFQAILKRDGLYEVQKVFEGDIVRSILDGEDGTIWLGTEGSSLFGLTLAPGTDEFHISQLDSDEGLNGQVDVIKLKDQMLVRSTASDEVFSIKKKAGQSYELAPDTLFEWHTSRASLHGAVISPPDAQGQFWVFNGELSRFIASETDSTYQVIPLEIAITPVSRAYEVRAEDNRVGWIAGPHGLLRIDSPEPVDTSDALPVWIRQVTTRGDSLLFGGHKTEAHQVPVLSSGVDQMRVRFAALSFRAPGEIEYRTRLAGLEARWSSWVRESVKDYTNLPPGSYVFQVQARDFRGRISEPASYSFKILPPWYLTTWAYAIWVLLAGIVLGCVVVGYNHVQTRRMRSRNKELESLVRERTESLSVAYEQARVINENLIQTNRDLEHRSDKLRDALEANKEILGITAHDLKNPLGGIIGLADMVLEDAEDGMQAAFTSVADHVPLLKDEAERMMKIITNLLDKHREGEEVTLMKEKVILGDMVSAVLRWNAKQAENKGIQLHYHTEGVVIAEMDVMAVQRVLDNYVSNAIKYSPEQTNVWIEVESRVELHGEHWTRVSVRDEGPGLTDEDKIKVFGKMQRLSAKPTGGEHSTGLGLYIVKKLVEAHGGFVGVDSQVGEGSSFWFTLPLGVEEEDPLLIFQPMDLG